MDDILTYVNPERITIIGMLVAFIASCAKGVCLFKWQHDSVTKLLLDKLEEAKAREQFWKERALKGWDLVEQALAVARGRTTT